MPNVAVKLVDAAGTTVSNKHGILCTGVTDADGAYIFTELPAGDYKVVFESNSDITKFNIGNYGITEKHAALVPANANSDVTANTDGQSPPTVTSAETSFYTLPTKDNVGAFGYHELNVDAGFLGATVTGISAQITAKKSAVGYDMTAEQFEFGLYDNDGELIETVTNTTGGALSDVTFAAINYTEIGTYEYTIKETSLTSDRWTCDSKTYKVIVMVTKDEALSAGSLVKLKAAVTYVGSENNEPPTFVNTYKPVPTTAQVKAKKLFETQGMAMTAEMFEFGLFIEGNTLGADHKAYNDADGNVIFDAITFDKAGVYKYTLRELTGFIGTEGTWGFDTASYEVVITVTPDGGGLKAEVAYKTKPADGSAGESTELPTFKNTFIPKDVNAQISAYKSTQGANMIAGQFTFGLYDEDGILVKTAANTSAGALSTVIFADINYTKVGIYKYTIKEITTSLPGDGTWIFDTNTYNATVTVTLNEDEDALEAAVTYGTTTPPTFVNKYYPPPPPPGTDTTTSKPEDSTTPKDTETTGPKETETTGPKETETTGPKETETTGPKETETTGPKDTETTGPDDTTPEITRTNPDDPEPEEDELPRYTISQVPDPNDPNSPDEFILVNGLGIPLGVFKKVQQPDGSYIYVDLDGVPLGSGTPTTGDNVLKLVIAVLLSASAIGMVVFLTLMKKKSRRKA
jgi:streptococcal pilin isopeptide linkage domain